MALLKDEKKQSLLDRYLDIEWCDDVSDFRCVHCHRVAINHFMSNCQHIFCKACKKFYSDEDQKLKCPQCQELITQLDNQDFNVEMKLNQLKIFCPNKKYGCNYTDQLRKLPSHMLVCVHSKKEALPVEASVTNTMADVVNQLTQLNATMTEVKNKVDRLEKKSDNIESKMNALINEEKKNEGTKANEFQSIRSGLEPLNQRIVQSEWLQQQTMAFEMGQVKAKMDSMGQPNKIVQTKKSELNFLKAETYDWMIQGVERNLKDGCKYKSEVIKFAGCKFDIRAKIFVDLNDGPILINLQFKDGDEFNRFHYSEAFGAVTYIVRDQSDRAKKRDFFSKVCLRFGEGCGYCKWVLSGMLYKDMLSPPYVKDDSIKISLLFEPPSIDCDSMPKNGVLLWRLENYEKRKAENQLDEIWSPNFYTSPHGYRVGIQLTINPSKFISLQVYFLAGAHDATLPTSWYHKTAVTLINQVDASENMEKSTYRNIDDVGFDIFAINFHTSTPIESNGFIKDDSLLIQVAIEPVGRSKNFP